MIRSVDLIARRGARVAELSQDELLKEKATRQRRLDRAARKGMRYGALIGVVQTLTLMGSAVYFLGQNHGFKSIASGELPLVLLFLIPVGCALAAFCSLIGSNLAQLYVEYLFPESKLGE